MMLHGAMGGDAKADLPVDCIDHTTIFVLSCRKCCKPIATSFHTGNPQNRNGERYVTT